MWSSVASSNEFESKRTLLYAHVNECPLLTSSFPWVGGYEVFNPWPLQNRYCYLWNLDWRVTIPSLHSTILHNIKEEMFESLIILLAVTQARDGQSKQQLFFVGPRRGWTFIHLKGKHLYILHFPSVNRKRVKFGCNHCIDTCRVRVEHLDSVKLFLDSCPSISEGQAHES